MRRMARVTKQSAGQAVTATQARSHFGEMIRRANVGQETIVVERDGIPTVVILSVPRYEELVREVRLARFDRLSRAAGLAAEAQGLTEEQLEREMEAIKEQRYQHSFG